MDKKINIQVPISIKEKEILDRVILNRLGLSINNSIIMFLKKVIEEKGLPFDVSTPKPNEAALELMWNNEYYDDEQTVIHNEEELKEWFNSIINESEDED